MVAKELGIKVDGLQSSKVLGNAARLNLVNVYSGFDLYLSTFRSEFFNLLKKEWRSNTGDTPFDEIRRNIDLNGIESTISITPHQIKLFDYYRLTRNSIVHPSKKNRDSALNFYSKEIESLKEIRLHYKMVNAPNSLDSLDFHDVKLFSRTLLDLLPLLDEQLDPGNEMLRAMIPCEKWLNLEADRRKNAKIGFLKSNFGISTERSKEILTH